MGPQPPAFHNRRVQGTLRGLEGRSWRGPPAVPSPGDSPVQPGCSAAPPPWGTGRERRGSLAPGRQPPAARKSDRRTVRGPGWLWPAAGAAGAAVAAVAGVAAGAQPAEEPGAGVPRAGGAAAAPGTG